MCIRDSPVCAQRRERELGEFIDADLAVRKDVLARLTALDVVDAHTAVTGRTGAYESEHGVFEYPDALARGNRDAAR